MAVNVNNFSELDKMGAKEGRANAGMAKEGVLMALGYPATR
jgi:hypothetical protein